MMMMVLLRPESLHHLKKVKEELILAPRNLIMAKFSGMVRLLTKIRLSLTLIEVTFPQAAKFSYFWIQRLQLRKTYRAGMNLSESC